MSGRRRKRAPKDMYPSRIRWLWMHSGILTNICFFYIFVFIFWFWNTKQVPEAIAWSRSALLGIGQKPKKMQLMPSITAASVITPHTAAWCVAPFGPRIRQLTCMSSLGCLRDQLFASFQKVCSSGHLTISIFFQGGNVWAVIALDMQREGLVTVANRKQWGLASGRQGKWFLDENLLNRILQATNLSMNNIWKPFPNILSK